MATGQREARTPGPPRFALHAHLFDAAVFDMDGVVTDTALTHRRVWKEMFDRFLAEESRRTGRRHDPFTDDDYLRFVDGRHRDDGVRGFLASRGVDLPPGAPEDPQDRNTVWGLANRKDAAFRRLVTSRGVRAFPTTVALVRDLQRHGLGTAIISASRNCGRILRAAGVDGLFPVVVDGAETTRLGLPGKPSPAVFLEAARRLGSEPARTLVIEDALAGVQAGRDGHFGLVLGVARAGPPDRMLAEGADAVVTDLGNVRLLP